MNGTPRVLNRILLGLVGLLLMLAGVLAIVLAAVPAAAPWWHSLTRSAGERVGRLLSETTLPGERDSWLWIVLAVLMIVVVVLMVVWVANQGKGRADILAEEDGDPDVAGLIVLSAAVAEQALRAALLERRDIVNATVTTFEVKGRNAIRIRVYPRQGVPPYLIAEDVGELVEAADAVIGCRPPVLVSIGGGARARFVRAERVR